MIPLVNKTATKRTAQGFKACVDRIGCEPEVVEAVIAVEAAGRGWDRQGRLRMLFEPHVFYRVLARNNQAALPVAVSDGLAYPKWGERPYPADSYPRLESARRINEEFALRGASWGLPQILGENYEGAGYKSATDMVTSFLAGEDEQLTALANFIVDKKLDGALRGKQWAVFARGYNGKGYAKNAYDVKLQAAYGKAKRRATVGRVATTTATASTVGAPVGGGGTVAAGGDTAETGIVVGVLLVIGAAAWMFSKWVASRAIVVDTAPLPKIDDDEPEAPAETLAITASPTAELSAARADMRLAKIALAKARELVAEKVAAVRESAEALQKAMEEANSEIAEATDALAEPKKTAPTHKASAKAAPAEPAIAGE